LNSKLKMFIKFDVFGKRMSVQRKDGEWLLFQESNTGVRARVFEVVFPSDLEESGLATYLADIYHETASENHPYVVKLE
jgi:hypothetical protein